jgi:hypothetical protein
MHVYYIQKNQLPGVCVNLVIASSAMKLKGKPR